MKKDRVRERVCCQEIVAFTVRKLVSDATISAVSVMSKS